MKKRKHLREETVSEHYAGLLGVKEPWRVSEVDREPEVERVCVRIEWPVGISPLCPECGRAGRHGQGERGVPGMPGILATSDHLLESRSFMKKRQGSREGAKSRRREKSHRFWNSSCLRVSPPKSAIKALRFLCSLLRCFPGCAALYPRLDQGTRRGSRPDAPGRDPRAPAKVGYEACGRLMRA